MKAYGWWGYFDGTNPCPVPNDSQNVTKEEKEEVEKWEQEDCVASYLLLQCLHDYTALCMDAYPTTQSQWDRIRKEFTAMSGFVQTRLETAFYEMRCQRGGDVRAFLTNLCYKRCELAAAGVRITNRDYLRTALRGLPEDLATFASSCLASARIADCATTIDIETFFNCICAEADRRKNRRAHSQRHGRCNRCRKAGHRERECRQPANREQQPGGDAQRPEVGQNSAKPVAGSSTRDVVLTTDEVGDGCWTVFIPGSESGGRHIH